MNVALYVRVSTRDGRQNTRNQLSALRTYCRKMGWTITAEYVERANSGNEDEDLPPQLAKMFIEASKRKFDRLLVWAVDTLNQRTVAETFAMIQRLKASRVDIWSLTEEYFRPDGSAGDLFIAMAAWIAKKDRNRLKDAISAGMLRAKMDGRVLGRPRAPYGPSEIQALRNTGMKLDEIANQTGMTRQTVHLRLKEAQRLAS